MIKVIPKSTTHRLDATNVSLGRLASQIATLLRGKHKPTFSPHLDQGDAVIVSNAQAVRLTGQKLQAKRYFRHSGHLGHLKSVTAGELMAKKPADLLYRAVAGMLPRTRLKKGQLKRLTILSGNPSTSLRIKE